MSINFGGVVTEKKCLGREICFSSWVPWPISRGKLKLVVGKKPECISTKWAPTSNK